MKKVILSAVMALAMVASGTVVGQNTTKSTAKTEKTCSDKKSGECSSKTKDAKACDKKAKKETKKSCCKTKTESTKK